jgi:hypothetical protein
MSEEPEVTEEGTEYSWEERVAPHGHRWEGKGTDAAGWTLFRCACGAGYGVPPEA